MTKTLEIRDTLLGCSVNDGQPQSEAQLPGAFR